MHCDYWIPLLVLTVLAVSSRAYSIEELNSVTLVLDVSLTEFQENPEIKSTVFDLIANFSTKNCTSNRQKCKLVAKYYRNTGPYKRTINDTDYIFSPNDISELKEASEWEDETNSSITGTKVIFNLKTKTGYDYLKWTELVRLIYFYRFDFNSLFSETTNMTEVDILKRPPTSYIAKLINENITTRTIIAGAILGSAAIMFIVLVPLSNTRYCRKEVDDSSTEDLTIEAED
ncbi:uncharacterized protein [Watersipora subatra]|uniref:uncharacterized protein isoform X2 n=1 Tax=Watersipora subatra TaxID=2589382 RepID=UPI00355BA9D1